MNPYDFGIRHSLQPQGIGIPEFLFIREGKDFQVFKRPYPPEIDIRFPELLLVKRTAFNYTLQECLQFCKGILFRDFGLVELGIGIELRLSGCFIHIISPFAPRSGAGDQSNTFHCAFECGLIHSPIFFGYFGIQYCLQSFLRKR